MKTSCVRRIDVKEPRGKASWKVNMNARGIRNSPGKKCSFIAVHRGGFALFSPRPIIFLHRGSSTKNHVSSDRPSIVCVPRRQLVVAETRTTLFLSLSLLEDGLYHDDGATKQV